MAVAAHRYSLGRQTYIVGCCLDWLTVVWKRLCRNTQRVILRDTVAALKDDHAGHRTIDASGWWRFFLVHWELLDPEDQDWLEQDQAYKGYSVRGAIGQAKAGASLMEIMEWPERSY